VQHHLVVYDRLVSPLPASQVLHPYQDRLELHSPGLLRNVFFLTFNVGVVLFSINDTKGVEDAYIPLNDLNSHSAVLTASCLSSPRLVC